MDAVNPILAHKLGHSQPVASEQAESATSPTRQMRRALGRAADNAVGLSASVLGISEEAMDAESLIADGPDGWIVLGLRTGDAAGLSGLFLMDQPLRSALIEMQTMGSLLPLAETQRAVTRTDAVMTVPFAANLLAELGEVEFGTPDFNMAAYDIGPVENLRTAGLVMMQGQYRVWRVTVQLGGGEAQGEMMIALRPQSDNAPQPVEDSNAWSTNLRDALDDAPADLDAVLSKMTLPIGKIDAFEVGQVVQLAGTTVGSVTLTGPGGEKVATARLGQVAGKRAVRIEDAQVDMQDAPPKLAPVQQFVETAKEPNPTSSDLVDS
ncbi:flagellar motor switch protein FliM [Octadecabacter temperatus]|uniref:Flagellar motor switch protein FliM n=1 Tax=Octadecabacter temperatus TaxID=1458307 RepID=A0A0K0Y4G7_9RHOB|nr:FliM/FliN family flagellar motor C-terminal domain-containing protein [Octadecabacter temperatus]AKS45747.1 flagellar motor switch protein FliM [Octadecabacter temperatus]SIN99623.1 flagellar motor switch protein FliM [Octadecabacter temperatus]